MSVSRKIDLVYSQDFTSNILSNSELNYIIWSFYVLVLLNPPQETVWERFFCFSSGYNFL